jgi:hypothetical protein
MPWSARLQGARLGVTLPGLGGGFPTGFGTLGVGGVKDFEVVASEGKRVNDVGGGVVPGGQSCPNT